MNLKTIDKFYERRLGICGVRFMIVRYKFGSLYIFAALRTSILPKFTEIAEILQPSVVRFCLISSTFYSNKTEHFAA